MEDNLLKVIIGLALAWIGIALATWGFVSEVTL